MLALDVLGTDESIAVTGPIKSDDVLIEMNIVAVDQLGMDEYVAVIRPVVFDDIVVTASTAKVGRGMKLCPLMDPATKRGTARLILRLLPLNGSSTLLS